MKKKSFIMKNEKKFCAEKKKIELGYCPNCIVREVCIAILKLYCKNRRLSCRGIVLQERRIWLRSILQYRKLYCKEAARGDGGLYRNTVNCIVTARGCWVSHDTKFVS